MGACEIQSPRSPLPRSALRCHKIFPDTRSPGSPNYNSQRAARALPVVSAFSSLPARDCGCWAGIAVLPYRPRQPHPGLATRNLSLVALVKPENKWQVRSVARTAPAKVGADLQPAGSRAQASYSGVPAHQFIRDRISSSGTG